MTGFYDRAAAAAAALQRRGRTRYLRRTRAIKPLGYTYHVHQAEVSNASTRGKYLHVLVQYGKRQP